MAFLSLKSMSSIKKMSLLKQIMQMSSLVELLSLGYFLSLLFLFRYVYFCSMYVHVFSLPLRFNFYEDKIYIFFNSLPPNSILYT